MKGRINLASATRNAKCKSTRAERDTGRWSMGGKGGRERREGGGEHKQVHTSTNTAQQDTTTQGEGKEYYTGEIGGKS